MTIVNTILIVLVILYLITEKLKKLYFIEWNTGDYYFELWKVIRDHPIYGKEAHQVLAIGKKNNDSL